MDVKIYQTVSCQQQYQYKSFSPELVNHSWEIVDGEVQRLLSDADRALGE